LILPGVPDKEAVQVNAIAIERIDVMVAPEFFDARSGTGFGHRSAFRRIEETGLTQEAPHAREWAGRSIEGGGKCSPLLSVQAEELPVGERLVGSGQGAFKDEVTDRAMRGRRGCFQTVLGSLGKAEVQLFRSDCGARHASVFL
jgi:hypothetical protein